MTAAIAPILKAHRPATRAAAKVLALDAELEAAFRDRLVPSPELTRQLVSFQANKQTPRFRWYKYREGYSAALVDHLLNIASVDSGPILDPFAGSGTTVFVAAERGIDAVGIELLRVAREIIGARVLAESSLSASHLGRIREWASAKPWTAGPAAAVPEIRITAAAYPEETRAAIGRFMRAAQREGSVVRRLLMFALLCVLEDVSYTRKDGQYLRWDARAGRRSSGRSFSKGPIIPFDTAISAKLRQIIADLDDHAPASRSSAPERGAITLLEGSCLDLLPQLPSATYSAVITSPPYCNRYDYTRTYALELAMLGFSDIEVAQLRQQMVTCTVENRAKDLLRINKDWSQAVAVADSQALLQGILCYLESEAKSGNLNNNAIPRMVRGYFYEMACIIQETARVLKIGAPFCMVNDNVRYAGIGISVDLILSRMAEQLGFEVERILTLPRGKGNSSQQMGAHGRAELRKCVYVWRRAGANRADPAE